MLIFVSPEVTWIHRALCVYRNVPSEWVCSNDAFKFGSCFTLGSLPHQEFLILNTSQSYWTLFLAIHKAHTNITPNMPIV